MGNFFFSPSEKIVSSKIQICAKYDDFYNLTHENRGVAIIFNHEYYDDTKYPTREGTNLDRDRLIGTFTDLEFDIRVYNDLKYGEIYTVLNKGKNKIVVRNLLMAIEFAIRF